ncbi:9756_t:CDS:1, partial [Funneliformis mosseae]
ITSTWFYHQIEMERNYYKRLNMKTTDNIITSGLGTSVQKSLLAED